jgi:hypothetical protein
LYFTRILSIHSSGENKLGNRERQSITLPIPVNQSTMAYNGAAPVPPAGVWVKISYKGQEEVIGDAIEIKPIPENVNDLWTH